MNAAEVDAALCSAIELLVAAFGTKGRVNGTALIDKSSPVNTEATAATLPPPDQLSVMLAGTLDIEYPTNRLFKSALQAARCQYYLAHVKEVATQKGMAFDARCPPPPSSSPPAVKSGAAKPAAPNGQSSDPAELTASANIDGAIGEAIASDVPVPLWRFYDDLLPISLEDDLVEAARLLHPLDQAEPMALTGAGCGCVTSKDKSTYGIYPFWHATGKPQPIDFSLFSRMGYMGAVLTDAGGYNLPQRKERASDDFIQEARRHGTQVDLMLYRRNWTALLATPKETLQIFIGLAAANAVTEADRPPAGRHAFGEPAYAYDGLTIFFTDTPKDAEGIARYHAFFRSFMQQLIAQMQSTGRSYQLNVVIPGEILGDEGAYNFQELIDYIHAAEPGRLSKAATLEAKALYKGTTDIKISYLVLMNEPTTERKKMLRAKIDNTLALAGHSRVAMLESLLPVFFHPRGEQAGALMPSQADQLDQDLAYMKWTFGGAGFWPLPVATIGTGANVRDLLEHNFSPSQGVFDGVCNLICPNRAPLRVAMVTLAFIAGAAGILYLASCGIRRVRRVQQPYLILLWIVGTLLLLLASALLSCDPDLAFLRETKYLLYGVIGTLVVFGAFLTFNPRVEAP